MGIPFVGANSDPGRLSFRPGRLPLRREPGEQEPLLLPPLDRASASPTSPFIPFESQHDPFRPVFTKGAGFPAPGFLQNAPSRPALSGHVLSALPPGGAGATEAGIPSNLPLPLTDVTSQTLSGRLFPAGAQPTGPTQNLAFSPAPPPGSVTPGQEKAIPGTLYDPLGEPSGRYVVPAGSQPALNTIPRTTGETAGVQGTDFFGDRSGILNSLGRFGTAAASSNILSSLFGRTGIGRLPTRFNPFGRAGSALGGEVTKGLDTLGLPSGISSALGAAAGKSALPGFLQGLSSPTFGGLTQPGILGGLESAGLSTALTAALSAIPGVGPILGPLAGLLGGLFHGANPLQVPAAKLEQPFEAAADDLLTLAQKGMITPDQAASGMQALIQSGQQQETELSKKVGKPAIKGSENLTKVIQDEIAGLKAIGNPAAQQLNLSQALPGFIQPGSQRQNNLTWYPATGDAALRLVETILGLPTQTFAQLTPAQLAPASA